MKIVVTYEKDDILRLVRGDLQAQGIKVKEGVPLIYKGALTVRLEVETDDAQPGVAPAPQAAKVAAASPVPAPTNGAPPVVEDMSSVVAASQALVKNKKGQFEIANVGERPLAENESYDFPRK